MALDRFGRKIHYLRISLTDHCNLRCVYCMPEDMTFRPNAEMLQDDEILLLTRVFADLGFDKIRLTGGEPTVRANIVEIVRGIADRRIVTFHYTLRDPSGRVRLLAQREREVALCTVGDTPYNTVVVVPELHARLVPGAQGAREEAGRGHDGDFRQRPRNRSCAWTTAIRSAPSRTSIRW